MSSVFAAPHRRWLGVVSTVLFLWLMTLGLPPVVVGDQNPVPPYTVSPDTTCRTGTIVLPDTTESITPQPDGPTATSTDLSVWDVLWLMLTL